VSRLMPRLRVAADVAARKNVIATTAFGDELRSARHPGRSQREPGWSTFFPGSAGRMKIISVVSRSSDRGVGAGLRRPCRKRNFSRHFFLRAVTDCEKSLCGNGFKGYFCF
jgi:hypothetical protein